MNDPRTRSFVTGCVMGGCAALVFVILASIPLALYLLLDDDPSTTGNTDVSVAAQIVPVINDTQIATMAQQAFNQYAVQNQWQYEINETTVHAVDNTHYTVDFDVTITDIQAQTTFNETVTINVAQTNNVWNTTVINVPPPVPTSPPRDELDLVGVWDNIDALFSENFELRADGTVIYRGLGTYKEGEWSFDGTQLVFTYSRSTTVLEFLGYANGIMTVRASAGHIVRLQKVSP